MLSILTLLVLTAATLTYTSSLEVRAAGNFGEAVEARMAALTGLPAATAAILDRPGLAVAYSQRWASPAEVGSRQAAQAAAGRAGARDQARGETKTRFEWTHASQAAVQIEDEGGKLALNSLAAEVRSRTSGAGPPSQFDRGDLQALIERCAKNRGLREVDPGRLALSILAQRYGPDGKSGGTTDQTRMLRVWELADPGLLPSDPRFPPTGDDQPFVSIDQLLDLDGMPGDPDQAREALKALSGVLTVFTQCRLSYEIEGKMYDSLDPNTASPAQMLEALRRAYPDLEETVLKQWAVNVVDWRDKDSIPTVYPGSDGQKPILGLERTPYLDEVWPDSVTSTADGDDGQYLEIYNPYDQPIDVEGWSVRVGTGGASVQLHGRIQARGFLVVTDDLDDSMDRAPEDDLSGYGSFFKIFDLVGDRSSRRVLVNPDLVLPDAAATVFLYDAKGNLIDWFAYSGLRFNGLRQSAQRADPRQRSWSIQQCTPLARNAADQTPLSELSSNVRRDQAFVTPADLFLVPAMGAASPGAASSSSNQGTSGETSEPRQVPRLRDSPVGLDARLIDLFGIPEAQANGAVQLQTVSKQSDPVEAASSPAGMAPGGGPLEVQTERKIEEAPAMVAGRVNLNTAPLPVLQALPGMTGELAQRILAWRSSVVQTQSPASSPASRTEGLAPFESLSAFLKNETIWEGITPEDELAIYRQFANLATVSSQVFYIRSQNQTPAATDQHRPSLSRIRSLILVDAQGRANVLNWRFAR